MAIGTGSIPNKSPALAIVVTGINVLIFLVGNQDSGYWSAHGYVIHECEGMGNLGCLMRYSVALSVPVDNVFPLSRKSSLYSQRK